MLTGKSLVINIPICENIFKIRFPVYINCMKWINYRLQNINHMSYCYILNDVEIVKHYNNARLSVHFIVAKS